MEMKTVNQMIPNWMSKGIFTYLNVFDVPWKQEADADALDILYHAQHSGMKYCSPLMYLMCSGDTLSDQELQKIAKTIFTTHKKDWSEIWDVLQAEYNPISNYDMTETSTDINTGTIADAGTMTHGKTTTHSGTDRTDTTSTQTGSIDHSKTGSEKTSNASDIKNKPSDVTNYVVGFDSSSESEAGKTANSEGYTKGTAADNYSDLSFTNRKDTDTFNNVVNDVDNIATYNSSEAESGTDSTGNTRTLNTNLAHTLTRSGNIGVTTSQQMQQSSLELWEYNFFLKVCKDIDKMITIPVY